jgi:hypothetical protein
LSFRDKKSLVTARVTASSPILAQVADRFFGNLRRHSGLATALEDACSPLAQRPFPQRPFPLMDHRWVHAIFGRYSAASSDTLRSPFTASSATRALNAAW